MGFEKKPTRRNFGFKKEQILDCRKEVRNEELILCPLLKFCYGYQTKDREFEGFCNKEKMTCFEKEVSVNS